MSLDGACSSRDLEVREAEEQADGLLWRCGCMMAG
jgi:hypothetical protein